MSWPQREVIGGAQLDTKGPLMTRYKLIARGPIKLFIHVFHRSDEDREVHDHPWGFLSLILWGGYREVRPIRGVRDSLRYCEHTKLRAAERWRNEIARDLNTAPRLLERRRYRPGMILRRPGWWAHRVELEPSKKSVSLVLVWPKAREWGFFTDRGWVHNEIFTRRERTNEEAWERWHHRFCS